MGDLNEILSDNEQPISEEELLQYLDNNVPDKEKYNIEKKLIDNPFEEDAVQGLAAIHNTDAVATYVKQLNSKLTQLATKKQRKKRELNITKWVVLAIMVLLFICVIGYFLITLYQK